MVRCTASSRSTYQLPTSVGLPGQLRGQRTGVDYHEIGPDNRRKVILKDWTEEERHYFFHPVGILREWLPQDAGNLVQFSEAAQFYLRPSLDADKFLQEGMIALPLALLPALQFKNERDIWCSAKLVSRSRGASCQSRNSCVAQ